MISPLGNAVVREISHRMDADEAIVMRAFLTVGLLHQQEIMKTIDTLKAANVAEVPYVLEIAS